MEWWIWVAVALALWLMFLIGKAVGKIQATKDESVVRKDAIMRSRAVLNGQINEQLAPFLPGFSWKPSEARFIGKPVDFVVFKGMDEKKIDEVVFVEVKTGKSKLSSQEKHLKEAIENGKVSWAEYRQ